jgi:TonB family protein
MNAAAMPPRGIKFGGKKADRGLRDLPVSLMASTALHFVLFFVLVSQGVFSVSASKEVFVKVRIVELPAGFGGALTGTPGGKTESREAPIKKESKEPPKVSLPGEPKKEEAGKSPVKNPVPEGKAVGMGGEGTTGLGGKNRGLLLDAQDFEYEWYKARLEDALKSNWKKPYSKKKYTSSVHFVIETTGFVKEVQIVKSSGEIDFDKSVIKAVYDSQPFPKFPPQYASPSLGVLYTFELMPTEN